MRAARITAHDRPPELVDLPRPEPAEGEVQVRIAACGLNFADLLMQQGRYQDTPPLPFTPGLELAGTVTALGSGAAGGLTPGTRVAVYAGQGGLAEYGCFPAARCLRLPDAMPFDIAAGFQIAYGTSHLALTRRARLRPGETLVVLGAGGGVGLTAVEIGRALGARVIAVARGPAKQAAARAAGAALVTEATGDSLTDLLRAEGGCDVVYDAIGGPATAACLRALRPEGRLLVIGFASGTLPDLPANHLLVKNVDVLGFYWGGYLRFAPGLLTESLAELLDWHAAGRLAPHIGARFALEALPAAYAALAARDTTGKIVVTIGAPDAGPGTAQPV